MVGSLRRRRAFTLIELLIVIGIIAVLLGLLAAGVQRVREAANRAECMNNLRQLGLAYHNYRLNNEVLPPMAMTNPKTAWAPFILPYMEQENLANQYDFTIPFNKPPNQAVVKTRLKSLQCPSAPRRNAKQDPYSVTVYGVAGVDLQWQASPADYTPLDGGSPGLLEWCGVTKVPPYERRYAALSVDKSTPLSDITDGASNTILLAEVAGLPELWRERRDTGSLVDLFTAMGYGGWGDGFSHAYIFGSTKDGLTTPGDCGINCSNAYGLYAFHTGGANTVFVDGSVHFLKETMSMHDVLIPLVTGAGGEVIPDY